LFGLGMVLASGGSKTLIRISGGNLSPSWCLWCWDYGLQRFLGVVLIPGYILSPLIPPRFTSLLVHLSIARPPLHLALGLIVGAAFIAYALASKAFWIAENLFAGIAVDWHLWCGGYQASRICR
jgi:hypothetical protein